MSSGSVSSDFVSNSKNNFTTHFTRVLAAIATALRRKHFKLPTVSMVPPVASPKHGAVLSFVCAAGAKMVLSSLLAMVLLGGAAALDTPGNPSADAVVLSFVNTGASAEGDAELV